MKLVPLERKECGEFVNRLHRHHDPVFRDRFRIGCEVDGVLVGVIQVGNPVARMLCDGKTLEVVRCCTDGTKNACSYLYSAAARVARDLGYSKIITYILDTEDGASLRAAGWRKECDIKGHNWNCPSRPRKTTAPTCDKQRWAKEL
ncbi:MAG: hypothetical protein IJL39_05210 [Clostridia bacterium]|nr:hypothetical protein [Clostridia bacterium]